MTQIYQINSDDFDALVAKANDYLLSPAHAAERLDISVKHVGRLADKGVLKRHYLPPVKIPGMKQLVRYKLSEVLAAARVNPEI